MKKAIGGICIICVLLIAFLAVKTFVFDENVEIGQGGAESSVQATYKPDVESVIASAVNPTETPESNVVQPEATPESTPEPTAIPTAEPTVVPTAVPTPEPTATPETVVIPDPTKVPAPAATATPTPAVTETPETPVEEASSITDEDIAYVAELLDVPEDKVREVIKRAEEAGYDLDPNEIMSGNFDVMEVWSIVTDVFGKKEAAELLFKVMKLGVM